MFTAMRQATRSGATRVRLGRGGKRDLRWQQRWLPVPTDGVAFFPLNHFPPSGFVDLLEFAYDASDVEGLGDPCLKWGYDRRVVEEDNRFLDGPGNLKGGSPQLESPEKVRALERPVMKTVCVAMMSGCTGCVDAMTLVGSLKVTSVVC